jgi:hypothetical protein
VIFQVVPSIKSNQARNFHEFVLVRTVSFQRPMRIFMGACCRTVHGTFTLISTTLCKGGRKPAEWQACKVLILIGSLVMGRLRETKGTTEMTKVMQTAVPNATAAAATVLAAAIAWQANTAAESRWIQNSGHIWSGG